MITGAAVGWPERFEMKQNIFTSLSARKPVAFENRGGWKKDENGALVVDSSGNPIYVDNEGAEQSVDQTTISRLNGEAKSHREAKEAAEAKLKAFDGLDPKKAREAIATVAKIDQKQLIEAGEVDKVKDEISRGFTEQMNELKATNANLQQANDRLTLDFAMSGSKFINERVAVPAEMFVAQFGKNFKVEEGKVVPYGPDGNKIFSKKRMGEMADVDEALEILVENYPYKDTILKAVDQSGSGNSGGGGNRGGGRIMRRSEFDGLSPAKQAEAAGLASKGELSIVD